jgi:vitamin B12 transporter
MPAPVASAVADSAAIGVDSAAVVGRSVRWKDSVSFTVPQASRSAQYAKQDDSGLTVDRMTVVGKRFESLRPSVRSIPAEEFRGMYKDLPSVLESESGTTVRRTGAFGEYSVASIRGGAARHLQVYLNGMPVNSASSGIVDFAKIPLGALQRIDIYKEQIPFEMMEDGLGGVISLSTISRSDLASVDCEAGSYGYLKGGALVSVLGKAVDQQVSVDYGYAKNDYPFKYDNGTPYNSSDDYIRRKTNNDFTSVFGGYSNVFRFGGGGMLLLSNASYLRDDKGEFLLYSDDTAQGIRNTSTFVSLSERYEANVMGRSHLFVLVQGKYKSDSLSDPLGRLSTGASETYSHSMPFGEARAGLRCPINRNLCLNGLAFSSLEQFTSSLAGGKLPLFAQRLKVAGGLQCDFAPFSWLRCKASYVHRYELDTSNGTFERAVFVSKPQKIREQLPNAQASVEWQPLESIMAYLGGYYQSRNPDFDEKFGETGYSSGTPDLVPEKRMEASVGVSFKNSFVNTSVAAYGGTTKDKIIAEMQAQGVFKPKNYSNVAHWGVEWDARLTPLSWVSLVNSTTYMASTFYRMNDASLNGKDEPLMPRFCENLRLVLGWKGFQIGHGLTYSSPYYLNSANLDADRRTSKPLLDAFIGFSGLPNMSITYRIENYLDYQNEDYRDSPRPGRMHFVTLNFSLTRHPTNNGGTHEAR